MAAFISLGELAPANGRMSFQSQSYNICSNESPSYTVHIDGQARPNENSINGG